MSTSFVSSSQGSKKRSPGKQFRLDPDTPGGTHAASLFSKKAPFDNSVHPELRRLAFLLQSELGRHEEQIAKIQYEERKQAIERAFRAVTPLKRSEPYGSPESLKGSPNANGRSPLAHQIGSIGPSGSPNVDGRLNGGMSRRGSGVNMDVDGAVGMGGGASGAALDSPRGRAAAMAGLRGHLSSASANGGDNVAHRAAHFESMFLGAALQLLEKESESRRSKVGMSKTDVQQLIKTGLLMKGKGDPTSGAKGKVRFVEKKVTVTAGKFTYYPLRTRGGSSAIGWLRGKHAIPGSLDWNQGSHQGKTDDDGTAPDAVGDGTTIDYGQGSYLVFPYENSRRVEPGRCFIVYDAKKKEESRIWMAKDAEDRKRWMTSIRTAIRVAMSTASASRDIKRCSTLRSEIVGAQTSDDYKHILHRRMGFEDNPYGPGELCVPVAWVHSEMEKIDKGHLAAIENDMTIEQMKKDMLRDTFQIDGQLLHGVDGMEQVVGMLASTILAAGEGGGMQLCEAHAVRFAREVLYECSRSQFGGDCFYTTRFLCLSEDLDFVITPEHSAQPLPISFSVEHEPYVESKRNTDSVKADLRKLLGSEYEEAVQTTADQSELLTVHMEAAMVFEVNDMDLTDEGKLARVRTTFKRSFVFAEEYPVAIGAGNVHMSLTQ
jgi:hypothetical protein|eukprot:g513.t1